MTTLTDKLDAMVAVARSATPGPWRAEHHTVVEGDDDCGDWTIVSETKIWVPDHLGDGDEGPQEIAHIYTKSVCCEGWPGIVADARHIAQSHPTVFAALCEVARAAAMVRSGKISEYQEGVPNLDNALTALERTLSEADRE